MFSHEITRRNFLHLSAMAAAGTVVAACAKAPTEAPEGATKAPEQAPTATPQPQAQAPTATPKPAEPPAAKFKEPPGSADLVKSGKIPALEERMPVEPMVIEPLQEVGRYGGNLRGGHTNPSVFEGWMVVSCDGMLALDMMNPSKILTNVAKEFELTADGKSLTLNLIKGVKWSDGAPLTIDDTMFWWEDIMLNDELTPTKPRFWQPGGEMAKLEKVDDFSLKVTFATPYPKIVNHMAIGDGLNMVLYPKHFLSQYHKKYADAAKLDAMTKEANFDQWWKLFQKMSQAHPILYTTAVLDYPCVGPQVVKNNDQGNVVTERNPYYWKVDNEGNQLPYIDKMTYPLVQDPEALKVKILAGEIDWEALHTILQDYPLFQQNEQAGGYKTLLWNANFGGNICIMFNQTHPDPAMREIFAEVNFRRAVSMGIDRNEINKVIFLNQGVVQQAVPYPGTTWYVEEYAKAYTEFSPEEANKMLDEIGLKELDAEGYRKRKDGQTLNITYEYWNGHGMQAPSELVCDQIRTNLKLKITAKSIERTLWSEHMQANSHDVTCWLTDKLSEIFYPTYPNWVVPLSSVESAFGTPWATWWTSEGKEGEEPPDEVKKQIERYEAFQTAAGDDYVRLGKELAQSQAENLWAIGTVALAPMPVICSAKLGNIPEQLPFYGNDWMFTRITRPESWFFKA